MEKVVKPLVFLHHPVKNIRKHPQKQIDEYIRSIEMFGQLKPIVCTEDGEVLVGNGLFDALSQMGRETADCYIVSGLSEKDRKKLMMADNKVYDLGSTDVNVFDAFVAELQGDIDVPGFDPDLLKMLQATPYEATRAVESYGAYSQEEVDRVSSVEREANTVTAEQMGGQSPYAVVAPTAVIEEEVMASGRYVICPKCGEKIWL